MAYDLSEYKVKFLDDADKVLDCPELTRIAKRLITELMIDPAHLTVVTEKSNIAGNMTAWGRIGEALMEAVWECGGTPK